MRTGFLHTVSLLISGLVCFSAGAQNTPVVKAADLERLAEPRLAAGAESLMFINKVENLGEIPSDTAEVSRSFTFEWRGGKTIAITKASTTCSCVKASFSPRSLTHGTKGSVTVSYCPKGHFGAVSQKVFLYTTLSSSDPTAVLAIKADVTSDNFEDYPVRLGALRARKSEVSFKVAEEKAVERIACCNSSDKPLKITALKEFCPAGLSFSAEPSVIPAGGEGDLVIIWNKANADKTTLSKDQLTLILDGLNAPPSQRQIKIRLIK